MIGSGKPLEEIIILLIIHLIELIQETHSRATIENTIEIYENCTNIDINPEVFSVYKSGTKFVNNSCDEIVGTNARNRSVTYQIQYKNKQLVNQTINSVVSSSVQNGILVMKEKANITEGSLKGSLYYSIRYYNNSDFYLCNREPGLKTLRQMSGTVFFASVGDQKGLFTCQGKAMSKFHPGILFTYADPSSTDKKKWFESDHKIGEDFLQYLYFDKK